MPIMAKTEVPRIGRVLDVVGLVLFLAGGGLFVRSWLGFNGVRHYRRVPGGPLWAATRLANGFLRMQHLAEVLMAAGIAVFLVAWWVARRVRPAVREVSGG